MSKFVALIAAIITASAFAAEPAAPVATASAPAKKETAKPADTKSQTAGNKKAEAAKK